MLQIKAAKICMVCSKVKVNIFMRFCNLGFEND